MRPHYFAAIAALAIAPVLKAAIAYDSLTYPLLYSGATVSLPSLVAGPSSANGYQAGWVSGPATSNRSNAVVWSAASGSYVNLNPILSITPTSTANGVDATQQVGSVSRFGSPHAAFWSGTQSSWVDLNPVNFNSSSAVAVSGTEQVGTGYNGSSTVSQALLWTGTAASAVDLNASLNQNTYVASTDGTHQVGGVLLAGGGSNTAARLWTGTAASMVDLTPTDLPALPSSYAYGVSGTQQVGVGYATQSGDPFNSPDYQALLWNSSGASAVNLTPTSVPGINAAIALGTNGSVQCGYGYNFSSTSTTTALAWSGTAASVVNLTNALPSVGTWTKSTADSVNSNGTIDGTATGVERGVNASFGVVWTPTSSAAYTFAPPGGTFQFAASTTTGISVRNVSGFTVNPGGYAYIPVATTSNRQLLIISGNGLDIVPSISAAAALFDITDNDLDLKVNTLNWTFQQIAQAYNAGRWNGSGGISSSTAAANTTHLTAIGYMQNNQSGTALYTSSHPFDGVTPGAGDVLLKYTYYGDADLSGAVNGTDYSRIDAGYLADRANPTAITGWFNGDFNYDGTVNGSDYTLIDNSFNSQGAQISASVASDVSSKTVPEPAMMTFSALAGLGLCRRRSR